MTTTSAAVIERMRVAANRVERRSPLPAWAQIQRDLRRVINKQFPAGQQLPTERELSEIYGVSRITVRQALAELAGDGFVERRQGAGTFVSDRPTYVQHELGLTDHWRDRFSAKGHDTTSTHLRDAHVEEEPLELRRLIEGQEGADEKIHLKRLHRVDGQIIGLTDSWVVQQLAPDLDRRSLIDGSLSRTLERVYGLHSAETGHFLEVGSADAQDAKTLEATLDAPLLVIWSVSRLVDRRLLETTRTAWLGSRVRIHYVN